MKSELNSSDFPRVEVRGFSKIYGSGKKTFTACSDISFDLIPGHITGLVGPNGAGKTTLIKSLCGMQYPSAGTISLLLGEETLNNSDASVQQDLNFLRRNTGFVPETPELEGSMTVREILYSQASLFFSSKNEITSHVDEAVALCSLEEVYNVYARQLSKGYRQRTSLAKGIVQDPAVLVLDEFSGGLDPAQIVHVRNAIESISRKKAVLLSTHLLNDVVELCSSLVVLAKGQVKYNGTVEGLNAFTGCGSVEESFLKLTGGNE